MALAGQDRAWRLERLHPDAASPWLPATPPPILAQTESPAVLTDLPATSLMPVAAFSGICRSVELIYRNAPARLELLVGNVRGIAQDLPACRLILCGDPADMAALALEIGPHLRLAAPAASLAALATAFARGAAPAPRHLGVPRLPAGLTTREALAVITGHLADAILHWAPLVPEASGPEPVHQMRVAVRRLRSALSVFRRAAGPQRELSLALKDLAARLGAARDWDVFVAGHGDAVGRAFPNDARVAALLAAARKRRAEAYAALTGYLDSPGWRDLALRLAVLPTLQPWNGMDDPVRAERLDSSAAAHAAHGLRQIHKQLRALGEDFDALPPEALHDLRKLAKRLRYVAEFFAPLFPAKPTRRFLDRLAELQEALGAVNDSHVAASLMARLGGAERGFASGVVQGFVAASSASLAAGASRAWRKLQQQDCFWE